MTAEAKVGLFFLIALLLIGAIAFFLGDFWTRAHSYHVTGYFANAAGLEPGAPVRLAGVRIGRVTGIMLAPSGQFPGRPAAVRMAIRRDVPLYDSDQLVIQQGVLIGEKYVEVVRGAQPAARQPPRLLPQDGTAALAGRTPVSMEELAAEARALITEARSAVMAIRMTVANEANARAIQQILQQVVAATGKADQLAAQGVRLAAFLNAEARRMGPHALRVAQNLAKASETVRKTAELVRAAIATSTIPRDANIAVANLRAMTQDLAEISHSFAEALATPETRAKVQEALDNLHSATAQIAKATAEAQKILGDEQTQADLKQALAKLRETAEHLAHLTAEYDRLLTSAHFEEDVAGTVRAAREAAETGTRTLARAEQSLEQANKALQSLSRLGQALVPERVQARFDLEVPTRTATRVNADVDLQFGSRQNDFWRIGLRQIGEENRLDLQRAFPSGSNRLRVGVIAGQPGVGYDWEGQRFLWETELWNPSDLRLDVRGAYRLTPRMDLLLGFEDLLDQPEAFAGVRYRTGH